ncbi:hypothetical protein NDU88_005957 [Pleurodeles waltl]|uniref:Secreted protein n=1 Tax=Pleurodeles waltl TaxID=8319 RepID=A0AAV7TW95_PLEWA|nr:hypothetical protein NDU88_005957 [Pleurodeles waltl]
MDYRRVGFCVTALCIRFWKVAFSQCDGGGGATASFIPLFGLTVLFLRSKFGGVVLVTRNVPGFTPPSLAVCRLPSAGRSLGMTAKLGMST